MVYTINETDTGLAVVDENGRELPMIEIERLAKRMIETATPKPIARMMFNEVGTGQLVLLGEKKKRKSIERTEEEKKLSMRTTEINRLYAKLRAMTMAQINLPMDDLIALLPEAVMAQIDYGKEGQSAKKLAKDGRNISDRQIVGCYKWLSTAKEHKFFFGSRSPSLHDVLDRMDRYLSLIPVSAKAVVSDSKRNAAYAAIEEI